MQPWRHSDRARGADLSAPRDPTDVWPNPGELRANYEYKHYKLLLQPGVAPANEERKWARVEGHGGYGFAEQSLPILPM